MTGGGLGVNPSSVADVDDSVEVEGLGLEGEIQLQGIVSQIQEDIAAGENFQGLPRESAIVDR